jgi:hypothetical protein
MIERAETRRKQSVIERLARRFGIEVRFHDPKLSELEGILCRGDSGLAPVIERAVDLGARFDGWSDMFNERAWSRALEGVDVAALLAAWTVLPASVGGATGQVLRGRYGKHAGQSGHV